VRVALLPCGHFLLGAFGASGRFPALYSAPETRYNKNSRGEGASAPDQNKMLRSSHQTTRYEQ